MENDPRFARFVEREAVRMGMFLGLRPTPIKDKLEVNIEAARSVLDSLEMLELKTGGNRTPEEDKLLQKALLHLRQLYSEVEAREKA